MANKGIVINVGFDSDIQDYINRIEKQFQAINWEQVIGLSDSFDKEYDRIAKSIQALKKEVANLGVMDVAQLQNSLNSVTQTTNRLVKQIDALVVSLPTDIQAKMTRSLSGVSNILSSVGEVTDQATSAINSFAQAAQNSGNSISTAVDRVEELKKTLETLSQISKNNKIMEEDSFDSDKIENVAQAFTHLNDTFLAYHKARKQYMLNKGDLNAVQELQTQFYKFKATYERLTDLDESGESLGDTLLKKAWRVKNQDVQTPMEVIKALRQDYRFIQQEIERYRKDIADEYAKLGGSARDNINKLAQSPEGAAIKIVIGVDDQQLQEQLLAAIDKGQAVAEKNPVYINVEVSTKYRIQKDKENLATIQAMMDSIQEDISNAQIDGATDKQIATLQRKLQDAATMFDKYYKGLDKAYSFHISVHTDYAMKQVKAFVDQTKAQLAKLKAEPINLVPDIKLDENFETKLKEVTEKVLDKLTSSTNKATAALNQIKEFFAQDIKMNPDFMKEENAALGGLYNSLNIIKNEVNTVAKLFNSLAGQVPTTVMTPINYNIEKDTIDSLNSAMASISDVVGEKQIKKIKIEIENREKVINDLTNLKNYINQLYATDQLQLWESEYLRAIQNIEQAFENLFGVKNSDEMALMSYLAKDISMTDAAAIKKGRDISEEDAYSISKVIGKNKQQQEEIEKALTSMKLYTAVEHGGYLTKGFQVGGLTSSDSSGSTKFTNINTDWRRFGAELGEGILSSIHSHAGDEVWYPSIAHGDLSLIPKQAEQDVPYFTTFSKNEVSVIDTKAFSQLVSSLKTDAQWEELTKEIRSLGNDIQNKQGNVLPRLQEEYENLLDVYDQRDVPLTSRTMELLAKRVAANHVFEQKFGQRFDSVYKLYSLDEFAKSKPYGEYHPDNQPVGLSGLVTTLQNVVQSITALSQNVLVKNPFEQSEGQLAINPEILTEAIINALSTTTININTDSLLETIQSAIAGSTIKVADLTDTSSSNTVNIDTVALSNALTSALSQSTDRYDATTISNAIREAIDFSSILETINNLGINEINSSLQEIISMLQNSNDMNINNIKAEINHIDQQIANLKNQISNNQPSREHSDSKIPKSNASPEELIKQLQEKRAQLMDQLNRLRSSDQQMNIGEAFDFSNINFENVKSLISLLSAFLNVLKQFNNEGTMNKFATGLNTFVTSLNGINIANDSFFTQITSLLEKKDELQALAKILQNNKRTPSVAPNSKKTSEDDVIKLGHVDMGSSQWGALIEKAKLLGIELKDIDQIFRQVERDGSESFRIFDKLGNIKTIGMNSDGFLFIKELVMQSKSYMINEFKDASDQIPALLNQAFSGNENAVNKLSSSLERINTLFNELKQYPQDIINSGELAELNTYFANAFGTAANNTANKNTYNQSIEYVTEMNNVVVGLNNLKDLVLSGDMSQVPQILNQLAESLLNLGKVTKDEKVKGIKNVDKLIGRVGKDLQNTAMPKQLFKEFQQLRTQLYELKNAAKGGFVPAGAFDELNNKFFELHGQLEDIGIMGKSMGDKIGHSLKNSLISTARMYLSWYRWIAYIRQGVQEVTNLDTALTKMSYTMNISNTQLQTMSKEMVSMAKDLSSSVENVSQIYQIYANLQTTQEELRKTAKPTAILANLSGVDAATAADQLQGVLNQFKLTADDAEHIVDVYDKISASIKVDYSKGIAGMADAVKNVGNFANEAGMSFEQLAAVVGRVMQQTRMEGGQIGVSLKTNKLSRCTEMCIM